MKLPLSSCAAIAETGRRYVELALTGRFSMQSATHCIFVSMGCCVVVLVASYWIDASKPTGRIVIEGEHARAAKARRFLGVGRSKARA